MGSKSQKLRTLMDIEGYEMLDEFLMEECTEFANRVGCPAICMNDNCEYTADMEPDQQHGWCPECETNSVASALVLADIL